MIFNTQKEDSSIDEYKIKIELLKLENKIDSKLDSIKLQENNLKNIFTSIEIDKEKVKFELSQIDNTWESLHLYIGILALITGLISIFGWFKFNNLYKKSKEKLENIDKLYGKYQKYITDFYVSDSMLKVNENDEYEKNKLIKMLDSNFYYKYIDSLYKVHRSGLYFRAYEITKDVKYLEKSIEYIKISLEKDNENIAAYYDYGLYLIYKSYKELDPVKQKEILAESVNQSSKSLDYSNYTFYKAYYNMACAYSLKKEYDASKNYLKKLKLDIPNFSNEYIKFFDNNKLTNETDFDNLKNYDSTWFNDFISDFYNELGTL
jgi:hypothetical protein